MDREEEEEEEESEDEGKDREAHEDYELLPFQMSSPRERDRSADVPMPDNNRRLMDMALGETRPSQRSRDPTGNPPPVSSRIIGEPSRGQGRSERRSDHKQSVRIDFGQNNNDSDHDREQQLEDSKNPFRMMLNNLGEIKQDAEEFRPMDAKEADEIMLHDLKRIALSLTFNCDKSILPPSGISQESVWEVYENAVNPLDPMLNEKDVPNYCPVCVAILSQNEGSADHELATKIIEISKKGSNVSIESVAAQIRLFYNHRWRIYNRIRWKTVNIIEHFKYHETTSNWGTAQIVRRNLEAVEMLSSQLKEESNNGPTISKPVLQMLAYVQRMYFESLKFHRQLGSNRRKAGE
jgi:hypothetical protein